MLKVAGTNNVVLETLLEAAENTTVGEVGRGSLSCTSYMDVVASGRSGVGADSRPKSVGTAVTTAVGIESEVGGGKGAATEVIETRLKVKPVGGGPLVLSPGLEAVKKAANATALGVSSATRFTA